MVETNPSTAGQSQRPDWAPETAWGDTGLNVEAFGKHWSDQVAPQLARLAAEDSRRAALPQKAEDYQVGNTKEFKAPEGVDFKLDVNDPLFGQAKAWAHKHGLSQDAFLEAIDLVSARDVGSQASLQAARTAEINKLGPNGPARVDAVARWWNSVTGDNGKTLGRVLAMAPTADTVVAIESLIAKWTTQGAAPAPNTTRIPPEGGGTIEGYATMTFEQRRAAQDAQSGRRVANGR